MRLFCLPALATAVTLAALAAPARAEDSAAPAEDSAAPEDSAARAEDSAAPAKTWPARIPVPAEVWADAPPEGVAKTSGVEHPIALAVNSPVGWTGDSFVDSFAASAYIALDQHHALRGNLAFFESSGGLSSFASVVMGGDSSSSGRIRDAGAAWVWYPDRLWDGFTFEAGVLLRERRTEHAPEFADTIDTESTTYAGRAMIGWSWLLGGRVFLAIAVGLSAGREIGLETITPDVIGPMRMETTRPIDRMQVDGEGYLRFGFAFGG
jgi:hypothetical protein